MKQTQRKYHTKLITWKLARLPLGSLVEYEKNPVRISDEAAAQLARNLKTYGQDLPYVIAAPPNGNKNGWLR